MISWIISFGLILTIIGLHIGVSNNLPGVNNLDERSVKEFLALGFYCSIIGISFFKEGFKPLKNYWLIILVILLTMHRFIAPPVDFKMFGMNFGGSWQHKPLIDIWIAFLVCSVIASEKLNLQMIMKVLMWLSYILSFYAVFQYYGLDPWQEIKPIAESLTTTNGKVSTTLTHPNFSAIFIASLIPITLYFKKWWVLLVTLISLILIKSMFGLAIACACLWLWAFSFKRLRIVLISLSVLIACVVGFTIFKIPGIDSGRFGVWHDVIRYTVQPEMIKSSVALIGYGLGSFQFVFNGVYHVPMSTAHNEFIEMFASVGLIGVVLLLCAIWWMVSKAWSIKDEECRVWLTVFIGLMIGSCGLYIWQVQPHQFLIVLTAGILHGKISNTINST